MKQGLPRGSIYSSGGGTRALAASDDVTGRACAAAAQNLQARNTFFSQTQGVPLVNNK